MPLFQPSVLKFLKQRTIKQGVDLMNEGHLDAALMEFLKARSEVSNDPIMLAAVDFYEVNAHRLLAEEALQSGRLSRAEEHVMAAIQANPDFADMRNLLGKVYMLQGRCDEALAQFEQALAKNPSFVEAMVLRACAFAKMGMVAQTRRTLDQAKKLARGRCLESCCDTALVALKERDFDAAYDQIRKAFDLSSSEASRYLAQGLTSAEKGEWDEAQVAFMKALEYEPQFADVHNQLGIVCSERQRFDEAIVHFRSALSFNPHFVAARLNVGFALARSGRHLEALEELKFVVSQSMGGPSGVTEMIARVSRSVSG